MPELTVADCPLKGTLCTADAQALNEVRKVPLQLSYNRQSSIVNRQFRHSDS